MSDHYITLLTALASGVVGGAVALVGVFLTNRFNTARVKMQLEFEANERRQELVRGRGEELYELVDKWLKLLFGFYLRRSFVMQGKLTYDQCLELDIKEGTGNSVNFGRIEMLINVYFPSARSAYDEVIVARTELNKVEATYERGYKHGDTDGARFLNSYVKCQHSIENAGDRLKARIMECIRSL